MKYGTGLVLLVGLAPMVGCQVPGAPVAPAAAPVAAAPAAAGAPAVGGVLGNLMAAHAVCKAQFCASPFAQLLGNGLKPVSAFSGGIISPCCPIVTAADLANPADSPTGAAARIKADEAAAKERRANVRYLGTVDCRYWPEAKEALINALRADRNECVRLEAALALMRGCCCNKATIQALVLTVTGSADDGNPAEVSERVRAAAFTALNACLCRVEPEPVAVIEPTEPGPLPKEREADSPKEREGDNLKARELEKKDAQPGAAAPVPAAGPATAGKAAGNSSTYYQRIERLPLAQVVAGARRALEKMGNAFPGVGSTRTGGTSVLDVVHGALPSATGSDRASGAAEKPQASPGPVQASEPPVGPSPTTGNLKPVVYQQPVERKGNGVNGPAITYPAAPAVLKTPWPVTPPGQAPGSGLQSQGAVPADAAVLLAVLQNSVSPEQREGAADSLATVNWKTTPQALPILVKTALEDPAATVRVACIRCLARMKANAPSVVTALQTLRTDTDLCVQYEAGLALSAFAPGQPGPSAPSPPRTVTFSPTW
jgi:hypothetical protein